MEDEQKWAGRVRPLRILQALVRAPFEGRGNGWPLKRIPLTAGGRRGLGLGKGQTYPWRRCNKQDRHEGGWTCRGGNWGMQDTECVGRHLGGASDRISSSGKRGNTSGNLLQLTTAYQGGIKKQHH